MRIIFLLSALISFACGLQAQENKPYGYHKHDGFYLSMSIGPNFADITDNVLNSALYKYSGTGTVLDFKIGGAVKENFIIYGTFLEHVLTGPKVEANGKIQKASNKISIGEVIIGGGFTFYMMPSNTFISASTGIGVCYGWSNVTNRPGQGIAEKLNSNNWGIVFNTTFN